MTTSLFLLLLVITYARPDARLESPIPNLQPSWAASAAQSSGVAISYGTGVVVAVRTPSTRQHKPPVVVETTRGNWQLSRIITTQASLLDLYGSQLACLWTGFVPDVAYLKQQLRHRCQEQQLVYDDDQLKVGLLLDSLAHELQTQTLEARRPLGVQVLCIAACSNNNNSGLQLVTLDPTGLLRPCTTAAAIGKDCWELREALQEVPTCTTAEQALACAQEVLGEPLQAYLVEHDDNQLEAYSILLTPPSSS